MRPGPLLLTATVACGVALGLAAPWAGQSALFAGLVLAQAVLSAGFAFGALRGGLPGGRRGLVLLLAASALVRAPLLLVASPTLSDDVHRYVADGRLWSAGRNAWQTPPATAPRIAGGAVNHPHLATIYPPFAEAVFTALAAPGAGERAFRAFFALADLATATFLVLHLRRRGLGPWPAALFALHPLAALESAASGHAEALALTLLALAFERAAAGRRGASVLAFAAAAGVKPIALLAAPFLARTWGRARSAVVVGLVSAQYAVLAVASRGAGEASGLLAYLATWRHNDLVFSGLLAAGLTLGAAKVLVAAVTAALVALLAARRPAPWEGYAWAAAAWLLLAPVLHPWYALGLLVALPALGPRGPRLTAWALATVVLATYVLPPGTRAGDTPGFRALPAAIRLWELAPVLVVFAVEATLALRAAGREERWSGSPSARAT
ncbi:MAG: hypothetical protein ABIP29_06320 [Candidatus Eisenbacteria bacterium]